MNHFELIQRCLQNEDFLLATNDIVPAHELPHWIHVSLLHFNSLLSGGCLEESKRIQDCKDSGAGEGSAGLLRVEVLDMMVDFVWEQLNTGHWKDVPLYWRMLYCRVTLLKVIYLSKKPSILTSDLIKLCDLGLLMGDPTVGKTLAAIATQLSKQQTLESGLNEIPKDDEKLPQALPNLKKMIVDLPGKMLEIPNLEKPSLEYFHQNHFQPQFPILIRNAINHWPASACWSPSYIKHVCGSRTVPVEIGSKYTAEDWTQKLMTISDFMDDYMKPPTNTLQSPPSRIGYVAQHSLFDQVPELRGDIRVPEYCCLGESEDVEMNAWFGPASTLTPTHYDPKHNLLAQVFGSKLIRLFPPSESWRLDPHEKDSLLFNTSQLDMEDPLILSKHPQLSQVSYADVILGAGCILYIPPGWWHLVKSLSPSFSVSFWFQ